MKPTELGLDLISRNTRNGKLLSERNRVVRWGKLLAPFEPHTSRLGRGCPPVSAEVTLRIHFLQQLFGLSDMAVEVARFAVPLYRQFAGLGSFARLPDFVSILRFRHLLEQHEFAPKVLEAVNAPLTAKGLMLEEGTADDASLIAAPSSAKNGAGARDPEMHQTRKAYQWCFEMGCHMGIDADTSPVHEVVGTAEPKDATAAQIEHVKARVRAKGKQSFRVIKHQFGDLKARYSSLTKTTPQLHTLFALSSLWMVQGQTTGAQG
jgi:IS5 family transposase